MPYKIIQKGTCPPDKQWFHIANPELGTAMFEAAYNSGFFIELGFENIAPGIGLDHMIFESEEKGNEWYVWRDQQPIFIEKHEYERNNSITREIIWRGPIE